MQNETGCIWLYFVAYMTIKQSQNLSSNLINSMNDLTIFCAPRGIQNKNIATKNYILQLGMQSHNLNTSQTHQI